MDRFDWTNVNWKVEQDVGIARRLENKYGKHPSREGVRQQRMKEYTRLLSKCLIIQEKEGEEEVRALIQLVLGGNSRYIKQLHSFAVDGELGEALNDAAGVRWNDKWHLFEFPRGALKRMVEV